MPIRIIAGSLSKAYRTTVKDHETRLSIIEAMLVLPLLVRLVLVLRQRFVQGRISRLVGKHFPEPLKFFVDFKDISERAFWAGLFSALSLAAVEQQISLRSLWAAFAGSALSTMKNYVKQRKEVAKDWKDIPEGEEPSADST